LSHHQSNHPSHNTNPNIFRKMVTIEIILIHIRHIYSFLFPICFVESNEADIFSNKTFSWTKLFKAVFVFRKIVFEKSLSKLFCICLSLEKLVNGKHFPVKGKFNLVSRKVFSLYFGRKILSGSCEKFRNIILFVDYIKFDPQTFDCYIYFVLNICFSISSLII